MGFRPKISEAEAYRYSRLAARLNQAHPSHVWTPKLVTNGGYRPTSARPGCTKCPAGSPFHFDRASHLYIIEEEP